MLVLIVVSGLSQTPVWAYSRLSEDDTWGGRVLFVFADGPHHWVIGCLGGPSSPASRAHGPAEAQVS